MGRPEKGSAQNFSLREPTTAHSGSQFMTVAPFTPTEFDLLRQRTLTFYATEFLKSRAKVRIYLARALKKSIQLEDERRPPKRGEGQEAAQTTKGEP